MFFDPGFWLSAMLSTVHALESCQREKQVNWWGWGGQILGQGAHNGLMFCFLRFCIYLAATNHRAKLMAKVVYNSPEI